MDAKQIIKAGVYLALTGAVVVVATRLVSKTTSKAGV